MKLNTAAILCLLARNGMTRTELAERAGVSRQQISTIMLRGTCSPKTAGKIALGLDVPVEEICAEVI